MHLLGILAASGLSSLGFADKSLWDWIGLLGVPLAVTLIAGLFVMIAQRSGERARVERELNIDRAREATLQGFLDRITDLIIDRGLLESDEGSPMRAVAHARMHAALRTLDGPRKGILVRFLHDSQLLIKGRAIVSLTLADLQGSDLSGADLSGSDISGANLAGADLYLADLANADLTMAVVTRAQLDEARDLDGATLPESLSPAEC